MIELIEDILLVLAASVMTTICGLPLTWGSKSRLMTRIAMSFATGFVILSAAGMAGALAGVGPLVVQAAAALASAGLSAALLRAKPALPEQLDREDWKILGAAGLYLLIWISFFDKIVMWMAGDAVAHAEMIRMLLDYQILPVSLPQMGSYWEYYPKGFHYYAYPFASATSVLQAVQTIPVLLTTVTVLLLYCIVREIGDKREAVYAFLISCFVFPAHYSYLIWAGYPSAAGEMLLVAAVLAAAVRKRLLPLLLIGVLLAHGRLLAIALGVLLCWAAAERFSKRQAAIMTCVLAAGLALTAVILPAHRPEYLASVFGDRASASEQVARWYPALLAIFGAVIAALRLERIDRLALSWAGAVIAIVLLADIGPLEFVGTADRLMLGAYLPLSLLACLALSRMDGSEERLERAFFLVLLLIGATSIGVVLYSYAGSWGLPADDYLAIDWLAAQNLSDAVCINLDETGAWIYPMTGIMAAEPRIAPTGFADGLPGKIANNPGDPWVLKKLEGLGHQSVLIYVSSVSITRPGLVPPFSTHRGAYPAVNLSFPEKSYELLYDRGTRIYRMRGA